MEISGFSNKRQFSFRLLVLSCLIGFLAFSPVWAEKLTRSQIRKLELSPATESVFVQQDLGETYHQLFNLARNSTGEHSDFFKKSAGNSSVPFFKKS